MKQTSLPLIKWTGSKRKQAKAIVDKFPEYINTYYEPFLGGGSVLHELLHRIQSGEIKVNKIICCDINFELIALWNIFKTNHENLLEQYKKYQDEMSGYYNKEMTDTEIIKECQKYYNIQRERFNQMDNSDAEKPYLFFWIIRHSFNGLARYNSKGKFNSPYHVGGKTGISVDKLKDIINEWYICIKDIDIEFINESYDIVIHNADKDDLIYMDPPYEKISGIYIKNHFDQDKLYDNLYILNNKNVKWLLSYDGITGETNMTQDVPCDLYKTHLYLNSGQSNFNKMSHGKIENVKESLYINY